MGSSDLKYAWPSTVNVANFVTVKPGLKAVERSNFKNWREQMVCLLEGQEVLGFVDGEILPPEEAESEQQHKLWRRTDRLVKGWILGSVGTDVLGAVREKPTARDVWLELDNIFKQEEKKEDNEGSGDFSRDLQLYQAVQRGEWDTATTFFRDITEISTTTICSGSETALHIAVLTGKANDFLNELVEVMPSEALSLKDSAGETALHYAAIVGNTAAASTMVKKNSDLLHNLNGSEQFPILKAASNAQKETLEYLISEHEAKAEYRAFQGKHGVELLHALITSHLLDIALDLAHKYPELALLRREETNKFALTVVAQTTSLFPSTETFSWWQNIIYNRIRIKKSNKYEVARARDIENLSSDGAAHNNYSTSFQIISGVGQKVESVIWYVIQNLVPEVKELREMKATHQQTLQLVQYLCDQIVSKSPEKEASEIFKESIMMAAKYGASEIVEMIVVKCPRVIFEVDADGKNVFQLATRNRFQNVINLIHNMSDRKYMIFDKTDNEKNNLMHICGKLAPPHRLNLVAGAALQMQRELQWFKEMEKFVLPSHREWQNEDSQTPQELFTKEHEKLKADGETWMKDTANACTITAALIATVMFAAAFTVPGGLDSATGIPLFTGRGAFELFAVTDAISLFASITSLLMFLSILTARYAEEDFLYVLPRRLSIGLISLFVSIAFMLAAFGATIYLVLRRDIDLFVVIVAIFACFPLASLGLVQFPLFVDVVYSIYGPGIFGKKANGIIY